MTGAVEAGGAVLLALAISGWVAQSDDAVLWLAAIVGGLVVIATAGRKLASFLRRAGHVLDDWTGEEARDGQGGRPGMAARVSAIEAQLVQLGQRTDESLQVGWANTEQLQAMSHEARRLHTELRAQLVAVQQQLVQQRAERTEILRAVARDREAFTAATGVQLPPADPGWVQHLDPTEQ